MDSVIANLSTDLKEGNNFTDEDIAFALYKDQLAGWGYFDSKQVDIITEVRERVKYYFADFVRKGGYPPSTLLYPSLYW